MRIDKWLWTMRVYKTRSEAANACDRGHIKVNQSLAKASRVVAVNDCVEVDLKVYAKKFKIIAMAPNRVGAKVLSSYMEDLTPSSELDKLRTYQINQSQSFILSPEKMSKKDRREYDDFMNNVD